VLSDDIYAIDAFLRMELVGKVISDERTYVSCLTAKVRWDLGKKYNVKSIVLNSTAEQRFGCDGIILLKIKPSTFKVILFEAKVFGRSGWDYSIPKGSSAQPKRSHFSDQLGRQSRISRQVAVFELFIDQSFPGSKNTLDPIGSACVWHSDALQYSTTLNQPRRRNWGKADVAKLYKAKPKNLKDVIDEVLSCSAGKPLSVKNGTLTFEYDEGEIVVPVLGDSMESQEVISFMQRNGLTRYMMFDNHKSSQV
jgi:hypothetical protein